MRIALATALAALIATAVDLGIQEIGRTVLAVPADFEPYHGTVAPYTLGGVVLAGIAYWLVVRFTRNARRNYIALSIVVLVLSYIPDILLLVWNDPGATIPAVASLMVMHTAAALIVVTLLLTVAPPRSGSTA
ncbi:MAG: hypothetical protein E6J52_04735 [Chloroflexi bacterium]|nr:MAG: hypothetical protein E6J52_04735 [Chloroflexota bacterium]